MRVFVTGATGFIGSAVVQELLASGHKVTGLARSDSAAKKLIAAGAEVHRSDIQDLDSLRRAAAAADGAIHTAFYHEITHMDLRTRLRVMLGGSPAGIMSRFMSATVSADRRAMKTIGEALSGTDRPLVAAFATMAMRAGCIATEEMAHDPKAVGALRGASEDTMKELAARDIRAMIVRLPPLVHGIGDTTGLAPRLIKIARQRKEAAYVGEGLNRWAAVHRLDAARLFRLALEKGQAGSVYHAVAEEGVPFRHVAETIGRSLGLPTVLRNPKDAKSYFGWLSMFVGVDNPVSSKLTQHVLEWSPSQSGLLDDLAQPSYYKTT